ncbi:MAG: methionine--tRNA ligase subunit beta, partial [Acidobacteriota bacterium]
EGLASIWRLVSETNRYIVRWEPWNLAKDPKQRPRLDTVLYNAAEAIRITAVALSPVMPFSARELESRLGCPEPAGAGRAEDLAWGRLAAGQVTRRGDALFPRIDKKAFFSTTDKKETTMSPDQDAPAGEGGSPNTITIDDFMKVELRVGRILEAEKLAGADKLLKLLVDIGTEKKTLLAGIALHYEPGSLVGKSVIVVANLAPRTMRGVESQGMILAADDAGRPVIATFESDVAPGAVVR